MLNYTLCHHKLTNIFEIDLSVDIDNKNAIKLKAKPPSNKSLISIVIA